MLFSDFRNSTNQQTCIVTVVASEAEFEAVEAPAVTAVLGLFLLIMPLDVTLSLGLGLISGGFNLAELLRHNVNTIVKFSN